MISNSNNDSKAKFVKALELIVKKNYQAYFKQDLMIAEETTDIGVMHCVMIEYLVKEISLALEGRFLEKEFKTIEGRMEINSIFNNVIKQLGGDQYDSDLISIHFRILKLLNLTNEADEEEELLKFLKQRKELNIDCFSRSYDEQLLSYHQIMNEYHNSSVLDFSSRNLLVTVDNIRVELFQSVEYLDVFQKVVTQRFPQVKSKLIFNALVKTLSFLAV